MPARTRTRGPTIRLVGLALFAALPFAAPARSAEPAPDDMASRMQACSACHGAQGQGTTDAYVPRLAGKPSGYLYNQLLAFRSGRRRYPPMNSLLKYLPDDYLKDISAYFAQQRPKLPEPSVPIASPDILAHGEALVTQGDFPRGIPACSSCHGPSFTGMEPAIPGLLGLRASYISAQLGAWRYGTRTALAPDCMQVVAGHLTEGDVKAVAAWLSSRPAPAETSPAPKGSFPMPFGCGSEPN